MQYLIMYCVTLSHHTKRPTLHYSSLPMMQLNTYLVEYTKCTCMIHDICVCIQYRNVIIRLLLLLP